MDKQKEDKKGIRVAIYCRMATDNDECRGLEMQKGQLRIYAQAHEYAVMAEVSEVAKGRSLDRPLYSGASQHGGTRPYRGNPGGEPFPYFAQYG